MTHETLTATAKLGIQRALIIRQPHIGRILEGLKTWEMRSAPTKIRGKIGLIESGTGMIIGTAEIVGVKTAPRHYKEFALTFTRHRIPFNQRHLIDKWPYAWVLEDAQALDEPIPYDHPKGAVIWVKLDGEAER